MRDTPWDTQTAAPSWVMLQPQGYGIRVTRTLIEPITRASGTPCPPATNLGRCCCLHLCKGPVRKDHH